QDVSAGAADEHIGVGIADQHTVAVAAGDVLDVVDAAVHARGRVYQQIDDDVAGVRGVGQGVDAAAAVDRTGEPPAGLEGEGVVAGGAGDALEIAEREAEHLDRVEAGYGPGGSAGRPDHGVGAAAGDEAVDVAERAADAGGRVTVQADGDVGGQVVIVQGVV